MYIYIYIYESWFLGFLLNGKNPNTVITTVRAVRQENANGMKKGFCVRGKADCAVLAKNTVGSAPFDISAPNIGMLFIITYRYYWLTFRNSRKSWIC